MSSLSETLVFAQLQTVRYLHSLYLIFGVTGCCLNIILLSRRQFRTISCCLYFRMSSLMMLLGMLFNVIPVIYAVDHPDPFNIYTIACKLRVYFVQSWVMMYRWCLVAACFDRCALVSSYARLRNLARARFAYFVIGGIVIVWMIFPMHILIYYEVRNGRCGAVDSRIPLYHSIYTVITGNVLPVTVMIICAIFIRRSLQLKRQRRRELMSHETTNGTTVEHARDRQVFAMLLFQATVYFITQTPWMIFLFYNAATLNMTNKSTDRLAIERFISFIADAIIYILPVSSFYLYTLASRTFRNEFKKLLCCPILGRVADSTNRVTPMEENRTTKNNHVGVMTVGDASR